MVLKHGIMLYAQALTTFWGESRIPVKIILDISGSPIKNKRPLGNFHGNLRVLSCCHNDILTTKVTWPFLK